MNHPEKLTICYNAWMISGGMRNRYHKGIKDGTRLPDMSRFCVDMIYSAVVAADRGHACGTIGSDAKETKKLVGNMEKLDQ